MLNINIIKITKEIKILNNCISRIIIIINNHKCSIIHLINNTKTNSNGKGNQVKIIKCL